MAFSESNAEHSDEVAVISFGLNKGLNESVPLLDQGAEFISGHVHAIEVGVAVESLHFFDLYLHLSVGIICSILVQVSQRYLKNATFQTVSSDF